MGMEIIDFKATKCKHCYKCVRYCGVKAIQVKDERAVIMPDKCILCGHCLKICPQSAKTLKSDLNMVRGFLREGMRVVVSIAPSYMGLLKYKTIGQVRGALLRLGFEDVRETSEGAAFVTAEYTKLLAEHKMENIITTCCPSANDLVEIYYPQLIPCLAPVVSPMIAHGKLLKEELGCDVKVVFLGPCIAKKKEAMDLRHEGYIDAVLNFNDINKWLEEEDIVIGDCEDRPFTAFDPKVNRLYPVTNGVVNSVKIEMEGRIIMTTPAIIKVMDWASTLFNMLMPICTVLISLDPVTSKGHIYMFQALIKVYTAMAPMADLVSGSRMRKMNLRFPQPSIFADSYREMGNDL